MPARIKETTIRGQRYRLRPLGAGDVADLGEQIIEATALTYAGKAAIARVMKDVRNKLIENSEVLVVDMDAKKSQYVAMSFVFDEHFADRLVDFGEWLTWGVKESGLQSFLSGVVSGVMPYLTDKLPSAFRQTPVGSSTDSSIATA